MPKFRTILSASIQSETNFGLIQFPLNPIGLDTKKPRNYLIVRGLSRIFRFSSEVHSGAGGT